MGFLLGFLGFYHNFKFDHVLRQFITCFSSKINLKVRKINLNHRGINKCLEFTKILRKIEAY